MAQENVEIVRGFYESLATGEFFEFLDPHVIWINRPSAPESRPYVGHEGVRQWIKDFRAGVEDFSFELTELIDAGGDQVIGMHRVRVVGTTSGAPADHESSALFTLVNGKIVRTQGFETRAQALEAAGLSE